MLTEHHVDHILDSRTSSGNLDLPIVARFDD
jgi:hypothetical protein